MADQTAADILRQRARIDADSGLEHAARQGEALAELLDAIGEEVKANDECDGFDLDMISDVYSKARALEALITKPVDEQPALIPVAPTGLETWTEYGNRHPDGDIETSDEDWAWTSPECADVQEGDQLVERTHYIGDWRNSDGD